MWVPFQKLGPFTNSGVKYGVREPRTVRGGVRFLKTDPILVGPFSIRDVGSFSRAESVCGSVSGEWVRFLS